MKRSTQSSRVLTKKNKVSFQIVTFDSEADKALYLIGILISDILLLFAVGVVGMNGVHTRSERP